MIGNPSPMAASGSVRKLILSQEAASLIQTEATNAQDHEICGFLIGRRAAADVLVHYARPAENIYQDRHTFAISHKDYLAALRAGGPNESVVGIYHLHYDSPYPSCHDVRNMALQPLVWLIGYVSARSARRAQRWRCFQLLERAPKQVPIEYSNWSIHQGNWVDDWLGSTAER